MKLLSFIFLLFILTNVLAKTNISPLRDAARKADFETVKKLISNGVDPNELDKYGNSALSGAAGNCAEESNKIIRMLFLSGAELNHQTPQGLTPISFASHMNCFVNIQTLLELGADPKIPTNNGVTPLMKAVINENTTLVKLFLVAGVNIADKNKNGFDALFYAGKTKNSEIISLLKSHSTLNINDKSPLKDKDDLNLADMNFCGLENADGSFVTEGCPVDAELPKQTKNIFNYKSLIVSFLITWTVLLLPPLIIRFFTKKSLPKLASIIISLILFFVGIVIFTALGSQSKTHFATMIGAFVCYNILRYKSSQQKLSASEVLQKSKHKKEKKELSKSKKIWILCSFLWAAWVLFRTSDSYELIGFDLYRWDDDYFFLNLLSIPILTMILFFAYSWVNKKPKYNKE